MLLLLLAVVVVVFVLKSLSSICSLVSWCCFSSAGESKSHWRAERSVSIKHSRTKIRACTMPRLRRSVDVLEPVYVGLISRPISSITAKSWAYFVRPLPLLLLLLFDELRFREAWTAKSSAGDEDCGYLSCDWVCCCCCCCCTCCWELFDLILRLVLFWLVLALLWWWCCCCWWWLRLWLFECDDDDRDGAAGVNVIDGEAVVFACCCSKANWACNCWVYCKAAAATAALVFPPLAKRRWKICNKHY